MKFNEDSHVKIPSILHLIKLGYEYLSLKTTNWDIETNTFTGIFKEQYKKQPLNYLKIIFKKHKTKYLFTQKTKT